MNEKEDPPFNDVHDRDILFKSARGPKTYEQWTIVLLIALRSRTDATIFSGSKDNGMPHVRADEQL